MHKPDLLISKTHCCQLDLLTLDICRNPLTNLELSSKFYLIINHLAQSKNVVPNETPHHVASHLDPHCSPMHINVIHVLFLSGLMAKVTLTFPLKTKQTDESTQPGPIDAIVYQLIPARMLPCHYTGLKENSAHHHSTDSRSSVLVHSRNNYAINVIVKP